MTERLRGALAEIRRAVEYAEGLLAEVEAAASKPDYEIVEHEPGGDGPPLPKPISTTPGRPSVSDLTPAQQTKPYRATQDPRGKGAPPLTQADIDRMNRETGDVEMPNAQPYKHMLTPAQQAGAEAVGPPLPGDEYTKPIAPDPQTPQARETAGKPYAEQAASAEAIGAGRQVFVDDTDPEPDNVIDLTGAAWERRGKFLVAPDTGPVQDIWVRPNGTGKVRAFSDDDLTGHVVDLGDIEVKLIKGRHRFYFANLAAEEVKELS